LNGSGPDFWSFGSGGTFSVTGPILQNNPDGTITQVLADSTILTGSFLSAAVQGVGFCPHPGFCIDANFSGEVEALANPEALALLGLPDTEYVGELTLNGQLLSDGPPGPFSNGSSFFTIRLDPVPEPSSVLLLVFGMALSIFARNRCRRRA
jgi:hypothetical protein